MGDKIGRFRSQAGRDSSMDAYDVAMGTLPAPSESVDVPTSLGMVRSYRWAGSESGLTPVALIPGRSSGVPMWGENLPYLLASGRRLIAMDALGDCGLSVQTAPMLTFEHQAMWVDEALEGMGIGQAPHGGALIRWRHGSRACCSPPGPSCDTQPPRAGVRAAVATGIHVLWATLSMLPVPRSWRDHARAAIGGVCLDDIRAESPIGSMISVGAQEFRAALPNPPTPYREPAHATQNAGPCRHRRRSLAGRWTARGRRARQLPAGTVQVWPGTTHSLPMQVPEQLARRLRDFWDAAP